MEPNAAATSPSYPIYFSSSPPEWPARKPGRPLRGRRRGLSSLHDVSSSKQGLPESAADEAGSMGCPSESPWWWRWLQHGEQGGVSTYHRQDSPVLGSIAAGSGRFCTDLLPWVGLLVHWRLDLRPFRICALWASSLHDVEERSATITGVQGEHDVAGHAAIASPSTFAW